MMKSIRKIFVLVFLIVILIPFSAYSEPLEIKNLRHWAAPDYTRIVIDTSQEPTYTVTKDAQKLAIEFKDATVAEEVPLQTFLKKPGIEKIIVLSLPDNSVRIELWLVERVEAKVFKLKKIMNKPDRIVVDLELPDVEEKETKDRQQVKATQKKKIIVIDAGHGGEDPGAVGKLGTKEKNVVLKIARKLRETLNKSEGYRAFLTRGGDYYVPFKKRLKIARDYGADLFVSIHADAVKSRKVRGGSVYILSNRGASNEVAHLLARQENLADIIGGSGADEASDESDVVTLDMVQTNTVNRSRNFGGTVLKHLKEVNLLKFEQVQSAPFRVLKLPEIPSALLEVAYISNPTEEILLGTPAFQQEIADAVTVSIADFIPSGSPPIHIVKKPEPPSVIAKGEKEKTPERDASNDSSSVEDIEKTQTLKDNSPPEPSRKPAKSKTDNDAERPSKKSKQLAEAERQKQANPSSAEKGYTIYRVRKGDSLEKVAARNNTTVAALLHMNNMKAKDPLYVDRKLKVPSAQVEPEKIETPPPVTTKPVYYKVKRGDNLEKIAIKYHTTAGAIRKLNKLRPGKPLYVDLRLKIPPEMPDDEPVDDQGAVTVVKRSNHAVYKVRKGDTLAKIASSHNITVAQLLKVNKLKPQSRLSVGMEIGLPQEEREANVRNDKGEQSSPARKQKHAVYIVKKGDSLDRIAREHNTTIADLIKLNKLKPGDPLYVNRKLLLPQEEGI